MQSDTVDKYIKERKIIPDLIVPMSEHRTFKYFKEETIIKAAKEFGWTLIDDDNRKDLFMEMICEMDMNHSYKPVLIKAILSNCDDKGRVKIDEIVCYFRAYYERRRDKGLIIEKKDSIFAKGDYSDKEARRVILVHPFKRFQDMQMLRHTKTLGIIEVEPTVWRNLTEEEKAEIMEICEEKLERYYGRFG